MILTTAALNPLLLARHPEATTLAAVGTYLLLFKGAKVARGHEQMAFLVSMLKQILYDMSSFLVIIVLMVLATAFAFSLLTPQEEYRGFARSLFTSYTFLMFGGGVDSVELYFDAHPALRCLYLATTISVQIVMLNALIAIMGDTYSRVSEKRVAQGLQQRAELLVELAATMSSAEPASSARERPASEARPTSVVRTSSPRPSRCRTSGESGCSASRRVGSIHDREERARASRPRRAS